MISRIKLNRKDMVIVHFNGFFSFQSTTDEPNMDNEKQKYAKMCPILSIPITKSVDCGKDKRAVERNTINIAMLKLAIEKRYLGAN